MFSDHGGERPEITGSHPSSDDKFFGFMLIHSLIGPEGNLVVPRFEAELVPNFRHLSRSVPQIETHSTPLQNADWQIDRLGTPHRHYILLRLNNPLHLLG